MYAERAYQVAAKHAELSTSQTQPMRLLLRTILCQPVASTARG
jgi:hypothetical protein